MRQFIYPQSDFNRIIDRNYNGKEEIFDLTQGLLKDYSFSQLDEILKISQENAQKVPTGRIDILARVVNNQIENLTRAHETEKQLATTRLDTIKTLLETYSCPYNHEGYKNVWERLNPKQQKEMKENVRISTDWKIEIIKEHKKLSILKATHNGKNIIEGNYEDERGKKWIEWVIYMDLEGAESACNNTSQKIIKNKSEIDKIINYIPWKSIWEKISYFAELFALGKPGCFNRWSWRAIVNSTCIIVCAIVNRKTYYIDIFFDHDGTMGDLENYVDLVPYMVYEDC